MDYATEAANIAPLTRYPHIPSRILALNSSDSASDTEPQFSEDEHSSSDDPGSTPSSEQSSSEQPNIASTLVVSSSEEDTGNQSIASRTMARHRTKSTAPLIENDTNDPPPTPQPTDDNPLTDLQDRQRAPLKLLSRCLENCTKIESPMSEISDEEVHYGSFESNFNPSNY
jgi:hypothetical protein